MPTMCYITLYKILVLLFDLTKNKLTFHKIQIFCEASVKMYRIKYYTLSITLSETLFLIMNRFLNPGCSCTLRRLPSRNPAASCMAPTVQCHLCTASPCPSSPASYLGSTLNSHFPCFQVLFGLV